MRVAPDDREADVGADPVAPVSGIDVGIALVASTVRGPALLVTFTRDAATRVTGIAAPVVERLVLHPPLVPARAHPGTLLVLLSQRGRRRRTALRARIDTLLDAVVPRVSDEVVRRVDVEALVSRLDLAGLAQHVVAEIDLPEIIRESTGAVSSEVVREVRMRGVAGDDTVGRAVDRLLLRGRRVDAPS